MGPFLATATSGRGLLPPHLSAANWIAAGAILAFAAGVGLGLRRLLGRRVHRADSEIGVADTVGRLSAAVVVTAGLLVALAALHVHPGALLGALGIGGLAVAFAAQNILENFFASIVLQIRRPFRRGDQVSIHGVEGVVEGVDFRTVIVRAYDGERVRLPSGLVLKVPIYNVSGRGRHRTTLDIGITYEADLEAVRQMLLPVIAAVEGVHAQPAPEVWVTGFGESTVRLALRFWTQPDVPTIWRVRSGVAVALKAALDRAGVDMPFPQRVIQLDSAPQKTAKS